MEAEAPREVPCEELREEAVLPLIYWVPYFSAFDFSAQHLKNQRLDPLIFFR